MVQAEEGEEVRLLPERLPVSEAQAGEVGLMSKPPFVLLTCQLRYLCPPGLAVLPGLAVHLEVVEAMAEMEEIRLLGLI